MLLLLGQITENSLKNRKKPLFDAGILYQSFPLVIFFYLDFVNFCGSFSHE